ncbi:hypothetical protein KI387_039412, partial [Taxus chinensis]
MGEVAEKATCANDTSLKLNPRKEVQMSAKLPQRPEPQKITSPLKSIRLGRK